MFLLKKLLTLFKRASFHNEYSKLALQNYDDKIQSIICYDFRGGLIVHSIAFNAVDRE